jgi:hypothetical protein
MQVHGGASAHRECSAEYLTPPHSKDEGSRLSRVVLGAAAGSYVMEGRCTRTFVAPGGRDHASGMFG